MGGGHKSTLLHRIIKKCQSRSSTRRTTALQSHLLQHIGYGITYSRSWCQREVNNSKRHTQTTGSLTGYQLTHTGNLKGSLLNGFSHLSKICTFEIFKGVLYHTWAADTHTDNLLCFTDTMEGTCHKRIIPRSIAEHHQFGTSQCILVAGKLCSTLDDFPHLTYTIHIYSSLS